MNLNRKIKPYRSIKIPPKRAFYTKKPIKKQSKERIIINFIISDFHQNNLLIYPEHLYYS